MSAERLLGKSLLALFMIAALSPHAFAGTRFGGGGGGGGGGGVRFGGGGGGGGGGGHFFGGGGGGGGGGGIFKSTPKADAPEYKAPPIIQKIVPDYKKPLTNPGTTYTPSPTYAPKDLGGYGSKMTGTMGGVTAKATYGSKPIESLRPAKAATSVEVPLANGRTKLIHQDASGNVVGTTTLDRSGKPLRDRKSVV